MFKRLYMLIKISRKLATSGVTNSIYKIYNPPTLIKIFFSIMGMGKNNNFNSNLNSSGEQLCKTLQEMGTTFIKLGQFLATRPDIIGENLASDLEKLQDKLPPFGSEKAKSILREELGNDNYNKIENFSPPIAAASIAQVHFADITENKKKKNRSY